MEEEEQISPLELKQIAQRALLIQRHLLRRAWAVGYAAWSVSLFIGIFSAVLASGLGLSAEYMLPEHFAVSMAASAIALALTLLAFRRVRDTAEIRSVVLRERWVKVIDYRVLVPIWTAVYAILILSVALSFKNLDLLVELVYLMFWVFLIYALRLSFPGRLPIESVLTLSSLGIATVGSIVDLLTVNVIGVYGLLWGATVIIWAVSAVYARTRRLSAAPGEDVR
jgi:hypothetical protein